MEPLGELVRAVPIDPYRLNGEIEPSLQKTPSPAPSFHSGLVYDLRDESGDSNLFFDVISHFADELLVEFEMRIGGLLDSFITSLHASSIEAPRSRGEYAIEFVMLGLMLRRYEAAARHMPLCWLRLAQSLLWLRKRSGPFKPLIDAARAACPWHMFLPVSRADVEMEATSSDRLVRLTAWMQATGELEQEALRLRSWHNFFSTLSSNEASHWMTMAVALFDDFEREAAQRLATYTRGVEHFLAGEYARRSCREDAFFCSRAPVEYHLNMVAAEVMNRGLRADFDRRKKRIVLVPACMRGAKAKTCRAKIQDVDIICTSCDPECAVNRITRRMRSLGAAVYLVPHSTGFSRWLERWQRESDVGVTAVACMLNIMPGGYEMRARQIPSQCVPLDYPGCKKHWDEAGVPTDVNESRLVQIAAQSHA